MIGADAPAARALADVAAAMRGAHHDWWIIGSAAVMLLGGDTRMADIDLLIDPRDSQGVLARLNVAPLPSDSNERFRSGTFARWTTSTMPVEIMADLHVRNDGEWQRVTLTTRRSVSVAGETLYVPERAEMVALLHRFGRPKDLQRARLLMIAP